MRGFWDTLPSPIIGLSPMDGVTDAPYRRMVADYGKPHVLITEFTNVEGLARGAVKMLKAFLYDESERPVVAQIYGVEPDSFYKTALMVCELGFDGIDINMGCPANKVARHGSGAGLIRTPDLAKAIVKSVKKAAQDWSEGLTLEKAGISKEIIDEIKSMRSQAPTRRLLPVSVKTRIGYDKIVTEQWISHLMEVKPANISLHGRTLKQMYLGQANWDEIGKAALTLKGSGISILGNGDVKDLKDAHEKIKTYGVDGVLIGRATFGNPWFFKNHSPSPEDQIEAALKHSRLFENLMGQAPFVNMRKHLGWYIRGWDGAKDLRIKLTQANSLADVERIISENAFPAKAPEAESQ